MGFAYPISVTKLINVKTQKLNTANEAKNDFRNGKITLES